MARGHAARLIAVARGRLGERERLHQRSGWVDLLRVARLETFHTAHLINLEEPERFTLVMLDFLAGVDPPPAVV